MMHILTSVAALRRGLERVYPSGVVRDPDHNVMDAHLPPQALDALLSALAGVQHLNAVVEPDTGKSHMLRIGLDDAPDWEILNRRLSSRERREAVMRRDGILYWNVMLSRVGPFWTGYWNRFFVSAGQVVPALTDPGCGMVWPKLIKDVTDTLAAHELKQVDPSLLKATVPWLRMVADPSSTTHSGVTVYDAVFSDL
jgi:hypothetical protein